MNKATINGKEIQIVATMGVSEKFGAWLAMNTLKVLHLIKKHPVDMLIFEVNGEIRSAGYFLYDHEGKAPEDLDEKTIVDKWETISERIWFKIDDQGDFYSGTFLFPSEY